jgi:tRNA-binding protein
MHLSHAPDAPRGEDITFDQFLAVDIRVGTVLSAEPFPEARKPAYKLVIDFGPAIGVKKSSAQMVNFPPRQIGKFMSEVLTLGFGDEEGAVILFSPDRTVPNGSRLF